MGRFYMSPKSSIDGASLRVPEECIHESTEEKLHGNAGLDGIHARCGEVEGVYT
jgi:hypothetical protein